MPTTMQTEVIKVIPTDNDGLAAYRRAGSRDKHVRTLDACNEKDGVADFARRLLQDSNCLRIVGADPAARLITQAFELRQSAEIDCRIQIGSPAPAKNSRGQQQATRERTLLRESRIFDSVNPSCGGWHDATEADYWCYRMVQTLYDTAPGDDASVTLAAQLQHHPSWRLFSFMPGGNRVSAALIVCELKDPRWFRNPENPDSFARLYSFLGLSRQNMHDLADGVRATGRHQCRAADLVNSFGGLQYLGGEHYSADLRQFLLQYADLPNGTALRKMSQTFVEALCGVWLDSAYPYDELFVPEYLFDDYECLEFRKHVATLGG